MGETQKQIAHAVTVTNLTRVFDISKPWLTRLVEGLPRRTLQAVASVSFEVRPRSVYALVGESGSGKSTIGRMMVGLLDPTGGSIDTGPDARLQMIFQSPYASMNPRWRVGDIIAEPMRNARSGEERTRRVAELLELVGLSAPDAAKYPHEFSGGQRQRIAIARALAAEPTFIVCDEPTSALDVSVQAQVLNLMRDLQKRLGLSYLFISHDLAVVRYMADTVGVLYLGSLVEEADRDRLFANPQHPYTRMLLEAAPRLDAFGREQTPPAGEIPDPTNPPQGCVFHPRCPFANDRCRAEVPEMKAQAGRRVACHAVEEKRLPALSAAVDA
ncbi:MAG: oligopeptide/dipeptide ABC transporter ATP-binding protein [Pseudomonadota bacterium]